MTRVEIHTKSNNIISFVCQELIVSQNASGKISQLDVLREEDQSKTFLQYIDVDNIDAVLVEEWEDNES